MRILLIEDDLPLAEGVRQGLRRHGHAVDTVHDAAGAATLLGGDDWELVLLDLGLPGGDGLTLLRTLRARASRMPVIVLTARDGLDDRVRGLDAGADDYLIKPFEMSELLARIRAVSRRNGESVAVLQTLGPLQLDAAARRFTLNGAEWILPPREFGVLELLLQRQGRVVSKAHIQKQLGGWSEALSDTAIEISIHRLRKRLDGTALRLRTLRGFGYLLDLEHVSDGR